MHEAARDVVVIEVSTPRLRLRQWRDADREPFAAMSADAEVMKYFPAPLSREESDASISRWQSQIAERGWGLWAVESAERGEFLGYVGLAVPRPALPFTPCVEVGWRLARPHWGKGYATEAANAALRVGFTQVGLAEIVSFTSLINTRSRRVMERIGMRNSNQDFEHPAIPEGSPIRSHCLYRLSREQWQERNA